MPSSVDALLRTLLLSLIGGGLLAALGLPLGWMIGAMIATAYLGLRQAASVPWWARPAALVVLGLALGQGFTEPVLQAVLAALPAMLIGGAFALLVGLAVAPLHRRIARTDARTAFFAAIPGGVVTMAALAAQAGAAVSAVTLSQSIRMAMVVLLYPVTLALLGAGGPAATAFVAVLPPLHWGGLALLLICGAVVAWLGARIRMTNAAMLAPCLLAMALSATGMLPTSVPHAMVNAAQLAMGASIGLLLAQEGMGGAPRRLVLAGLASAAAVSLLLLLAAVVIGAATGLPLRAVVLGMAPGGMPEMAVTAQALNLAVPLVLGFHLVRVILCNLLVVPLWWLTRRVGILQ